MPTPSAEQKKISFIPPLVSGKTFVDTSKPLPDFIYTLLLWAETRSTLEAPGNKAVGDIELQHKAWGSLQIRAPYLRDSNEFMKTSYTIDDCWKSFEVSRRVVDGYMRRYVTKKRLSREPNVEDVCRAHNGSGSFFKKLHTTDKYWVSIKQQFDL